MECPRCGKKITTKYGLIKHLQTRKPCKPTIDDICREEYLEKYLNYKYLDYKCEYCNKDFGRNDHLKKHQLSCKKKKIYETNQKEQAIQKIIDKTAGLVNNGTINNGTINNNNGTITINNINICVNRKPFGQEDYSMLTKQALAKCLANKSEGYSDLCRMIYFNPKFPMNHTAYIPNKKNLDTINVHQGDDSWELKKSEKVLDKMYLNIDTLLLNFFNENGKRLSPSVVKAFEKFHNNLEDNDNKITEIQQVFVLLMVSNREMIENERKIERQLRLVAPDLFMDPGSLLLSRQFNATDDNVKIDLNIE